MKRVDNDRFTGNFHALELLLTRNGVIRVVRITSGISDNEVRIAQVFPKTVFASHSAPEDVEANAKTRLYMHRSRSSANVP